ncbi:hypothetical protein [Cohnella fermenti]|uniref:Uncharacterized protein n=1 Tax=Cohnella fermenti TaxID=2565925 RepID=A0A4V3WDS6_9BACL|nr:hypothetical protein [Cohnella fermenti]THF73272.1 hypothetical protein E6C55_30080 [Cohnella fermenti]
MEASFFHSDAKQVIRTHLTPRTRSTIRNIVGQAYILTDESIKHTPMLNWELGQAHIGYLRNLAVGYLFQHQINQGNLSMSYTFEHNRTKTYKYLVLTHNNVKMTFSQVDSKYKTARPAYFRDKLQAVNQGTMYFPDIDGDLLLSLDEVYLLLTYSRGGNAPNFINIGFPNLWRERINLMDEPTLVESSNELEKEEVITPEQLIEFRNFVTEVEGLGN